MENFTISKIQLVFSSYFDHNLSGQIDRGTVIMKFLILATNANIQ